jgi:predicted SAM-dependent methyltransferase
LGADLNQTSSGLLLNVGCGQTRPAGWINTDSSLNSLLQSLPVVRRVVRGATFGTKYELPARYLDLRGRWPFAKGSVAVVYASHVLEHLSFSQATHFFNEAKRVLTASGIIRIVVPDLQALARIYLDGLNAESKTATSEFLYTINLHAENSYAPGRNFLVKLINSVQGYPHQHKYMYDGHSLRDALEEHGFHDVQMCSYGASKYISRIRDVECTAEGVPSTYAEAMS